MGTIAFNNLDLTSESKVIDYQPFENIYNKFRINAIIEIDINDIDKSKKINSILSLSSDILINEKETIGKGYDISLVNINNKKYIRILHLVGQYINVIDIPENVSKLKLNINIFHNEKISNININGNSKSLNIEGKSYNQIVIGGKENIYGEIINKTPIKVNKFELIY